MLERQHYSERFHKPRTFALACGRHDLFVAIDSKWYGHRQQGGFLYRLSAEARRSLLRATACSLQISFEFDDHVEKAQRERVGHLAFEIAIACEPNLFLSEMAINGHVGPSRRMTRGTAECFTENFQTV
jgi:hypothetical protein